jgi:hypothetical protein
MPRRAVMRKLLMIGVLVVVALVVAHVGDASAACTASGKIVYAYSTSSGTYIYVGQGTTTISAVYYFFTNSILNQSLAAAAFGGGNWVSVTGTAASCPTTGTTRLGGTISSIRAYRNF